MDVQTFAFDPAQGSWSSGSLPELDSPSTLVLVFGAPELQNQNAIFQTLRDKYPQSRLVGCSTAGEILDGKLMSGTLAVAVLRFHHTDLSTAAIVVRKREESAAAAKALARKLLERGMPSAVLFLGDGVLIDQQAVVSGLVDMFGRRVPIIGAFAGDGDRYERPWVLVGNRVQSGLCAAVAFYGDALSLTCSTTSDWGERAPMQYKVTKAQGNVVYELNQQPALQICQSPQGTRPLLLASGDRSFQFTPIRIDDGAGTVAFHQPVPEGADVLVLDPDAETLINGAASAARTVREDEERNAESLDAGTLALTLNSVSRRLFLGDRATDEIMSMSARLAPHTPVIGLYGYGGVAPCDSDAAVAKNSALSVVLLSERAVASESQTVAGAPAGESATRAMPAGYGDAAYDGGTSADDSPGTMSQSDLTSGSLSTVKPVSTNYGGINATLYYLPSLRLIALEGVINETFQGSELCKEIQGRVVLDLGGIDNITSFGVRGWLEMMSSAAKDELYLASCSEAIVNQMLMVRGFSGGGYVVSFAAPYICTACSNSFDFTLDISSIGDDRSVAPDDVACPDCGNRAVFDDDPESFFEFLGGQESMPIPADVRHALADRRLESMTQVEEAIQKLVDGQRTTFRINRNLDEKIRWSRVLAGVEGTVRLDFSSSKDATDTGIDRMVMALRQVAESVNEIIIDQLHIKTVMKLATVERVPKLRVRSVTVPASCTNCGVVRLAGIDEVQIREAKKQKVQPETECRRCSASIPLLLPDPVLHFFEASGQAVAKTGGSGLSLPRNTVLLIAGLAIVFVTLAVILIATK